MAAAERHVRSTDPSSDRQELPGLPVHVRAEQDRERGGPVTALGR